MNFSNQDHCWMKEALKLAQEALDCGEVAIGCVFVHDNKIVASGRNEVNATKNATRHAELVALDRLKQYAHVCDLSLLDLFSECTLYVTVEPCIMCSAALRFSLDTQPKRVVFGAKNDRFGGCGSVLDAANRPFGDSSDPKPLNCESGLLADDAVELLRQFYQSENPNAPPEMRRNKTKS